ncbi:hypothetical protein K491DRAFT_751504 [Lophiostoma macrostomum CBS 122681]|uniref:Uncharacterized protein n=1 Tax=Lophiostoma macrostomum CBS 122681 TaxID=1314788 RepID=A0A6A6SGD1_9PLEO|nr:hypothetical protein K491DRAFT_751504 [Lophiostoma macrostomum CBS 122681]
MVMDCPDLKTIPGTSIQNHPPVKLGLGALLWILQINTASYTRTRQAAEKCHTSEKFQENAIGFINRTTQKEGYTKWLQSQESSYLVLHQLEASMNNGEFAYFSAQFIAAWKTNPVFYVLYGFDSSGGEPRSVHLWVLRNLIHQILLLHPLQNAFNWPHSLPPGVLDPGVLQNLLELCLKNLLKSHATSSNTIFLVVQGLDRYRDQEGAKSVFHYLLNLPQRMVDVGCPGYLKVLLSPPIPGGEISGMLRDSRFLIDFREEYAGPPLSTEAIHHKLRGSMTIGRYG